MFCFILWGFFIGVCGVFYVLLGFLVGFCLVFLSCCLLLFFVSGFFVCLSVCGFVCLCCEYQHEKTPVHV